MKHWMFGFALLGLAAVPAAAHAEGLSYNYAEAGYVSVTLDVGPMNIDGDGFVVGGSYDVMDNVRVIASVLDGSLSGGGASADVTQYQVGAGYHMPIEGVGIPLHVNATASYVKVDFSGGGASSSDEGYSLDAAVRAMLTDEFEVNAGHEWVKNDNGSDDRLHLGGVYNFTPQWGATVDLRTSDNLDMYTFGVRYNF